MASADLVSIKPAGYEDDCELDDLSFAESEPATSTKYGENSTAGTDGRKNCQKRARFGKNLPKLKTDCNNVKDTSANHAPRVITSKEKPNSIRSVDDFKRAVMRNDVLVVKQCLEQGVPADTVFSTSWTALMYAANFGKPDIMKLLLESGANPNYDKESLTVLMVACSSTCRSESDVLQCVTLLLEHKADVNAADRSHLTPLHKAVNKNRVTVVKKLLEAGAEKDKQDNNGYTALMMAVKQNNKEMTQVLINAGADCNKQTILGEKALDLASLNGFTEIESLLSTKTNPGTANCVITESDINEKTKPKEAPQVHCSMQTPGLLNSSSTGQSDPSTIHNTGKPISASKDSSFGERLSGHTPIDKKPSLNMVQKPETSEVYSYGELEVFLLGLNLGELIPKFHYHDVQFTDFLQMSDKDLQQLGITQLGVRKKLLDAIQDTHKMDWQTSSVNVVQYNKPITCADAVAMVTNIKKHVSFISSTIGYVTDQIKAKPEILSQAEDHCNSEELSIQSEEAITNVSYLYDELVMLRNFLTEVAERPRYQPASLCKPSDDWKRRSSWFSVKTVLLGVVLIGALYYKKDTVYSQFSGLYNKLTATDS